MNAGGGAPTIGLRVGDKTVAAARVPAHADEADDRAIFAYTIAEGDKDSDGVEVLANTLAAPDGSSITDAAGNALAFGTNPAVAPDDWQKAGPVVANAGADSDALELTAAALDASASFARGTIASYRWEQTASGAPAITPANAAAAQTTFTVPESWRDQIYTLRLTVTDADGNAARDTVSVLGRPQPGVETGGVSGNTAVYGAAASFDVRLESRPTADVTIAVSSSDTTEGVTDAAALTFTPNDWNEPQRVTARGRNRNAVGGVQDYEIVLGDAQSADSFYNGMEIPNVPMKGVSLEISAPDNPGVLTAGALAIIRPRVDYTGRRALAHSLAAAPSGMTIDRASGEIAWTPADSDEGEDVSVTVSVTDGDLFAHAAFTLTVMDAEPLETQVSDGVLTITDAGTNLRGLNVRMAASEPEATATPAPSPTPVGDGAPGSSFVFDNTDSTDPGTTSATTTISSLRLEKAPAESVPDTPPWITSISDAFVIKTAIAEPVELRFPITGLPAGVSLDDVEFYAYVEPLFHSGPGADDSPQWLPVARDYRYEGTAENPVYVAELSGVYEGVGMLGYHRVNYEGAAAVSGSSERTSESFGARSDAVPDTASAATPRNPACPDTPGWFDQNIGIKSRVTCTYTYDNGRKFTVKIRDLASAKWEKLASGRKIGAGDIVKWMLDAQPVLDRLGMSYADNMSVIVTELDGSLAGGGVVSLGCGRVDGCVTALDANTMYLTLKKRSANWVRRVVLHEYMHNAQFNEFDSLLQDWLLESTADWFPDEVYDLYNPYDTVPRALKDGIPDNDTPYNRALFFKLLSEKCSDYDSNFNELFRFRLGQPAWKGMDRLMSLIRDSSCDFGNHFGNDKAGSLEAAMAFYNYATDFKNKISLLESGEPDRYIASVRYGFAYNNLNKIKSGGSSLPLLDFNDSRNPVEIPRVRIPSAGAVSFKSVPNYGLPAGKKVKMSVASDEKIIVSIVGDAADGVDNAANGNSGNVEGAGSDPIGPASDPHHWFVTRGDDEPATYTYGTPGAVLPKLFATLINAHEYDPDNQRDAEATVTFEIVDASGEATPTPSSSRWTTEGITVVPSGRTASGGDVVMYVNTEEAGGAHVSQIKFKVSRVAPGELAFSKTVYADDTSLGCSSAADSNYLRRCWKAAVSLPANTSTTAAKTYAITASAEASPALTGTKTESVSVAAASAAAEAAWDSGVTLSTSTLPAGGGDVVATVYTRESGGETVSGAVFTALGAGGSVSVSKTAASCGESVIAAPSRTRRCWNATLPIPANSGGAAAYTVAATSRQVDGPVSAALEIAAPLINGLITFASNRDGNTEIYVMDADGSNPRRITNNSATDQGASISPDGSRIVFKSNRYGGKNEIYTMTADGSNVTRLTTNAADVWNPAWSPDGRRIAFESNRDGNSEIYVMDADGSNQTRLTDNSARDNSATWSPDGRRIAFASNRNGEGNDEIYVMDADGSNQTRLTNNSSRDEMPAWSLVGGKIAFVSNREGNNDIYVMDEDGSNQTRLTNYPAADHNPTWSPDGKRLAFDSSYDIYVMNADGSNAQRLSNSRDLDFHPSWGPARQISFSMSATAPSAGTVGQSFDIVARVHGVGGSGDGGGISISFPSLVGGSESSGRYTSSAADVQVASTTGWDDVSIYKSGDTVWDSTGRERPAAHLLVEASDDTWSSSSDRTLRLRVTPKTAGDFAIRIRGWICDAQDCERSPASANARDQQGHAATVKTVSVSASP